MTKKSHTKAAKKTARKGLRLAARLPEDLRNVVGQMLGHRVPVRPRSPRRALRDQIDSLRDTHPGRTVEAMEKRANRLFAAEDRRRARMELVGRRVRSSMATRAALRRALSSATHQTPFEIPSGARAAMDRAMGTTSESAPRVSRAVATAVLSTIPTLHYIDDE